VTQKKEMELRDELDVLLRQPVKYTSILDTSRSYPLLFGDPDQLASRRSKRERKPFHLIDRFYFSFRK
jgi:hypothetical protein